MRGEVLVMKRNVQQVLLKIKQDNHHVTTVVMDIINQIPDKHLAYNVTGLTDIGVTILKQLNVGTLVKNQLLVELKIILMEVAM